MSNPSSPTEFLKTAMGVAEHFGFAHLDIVRARPDCATCAVNMTHSASAQDRKTDALHGLLTAGACAYFDNNLNGIEGPVFFYTTDTVPRTGETAISLHILNVEKSIAEAMLIHTLSALVGESGFSNYSVRINSLGDTDSMTRYTRELTNFLKKRIDDMPREARELMKDHSIAALSHLIEKEHALAVRAPNPLEYLSDASRKHFREIVEYLDMSETPYEIDPKLIGHQNCYSDALFAFDIKDSEGLLLGEQPILARGGRYNAFVSKFSKHAVPATGAVAILGNRKPMARMPRPGKRSVPAVFMVQLGFGPKIKSLMLMNELRAAGIPVMQDIVSDSLGSQLQKAEAIGSRFAIIVGQKEFVDGSAIVRDLHSRSQEHIPMHTLAAHIKKLLR